ncbi:CGP-CTERM sorting domain-containing protein [Tabrizicola sp. SY72]|nr:CGP-CTERM sorting domain-containing protein [Tabrizicola sp. SY72]
MTAAPLSVRMCGPAWMMLLAALLTVRARKTVASVAPL